MNELIIELSPSLVTLAGTLLVALATWLGTLVGTKLNTILAGIKDKQLAERIKKVIVISVRYAEQVGRELGSEEKFEKAKVTALKLLAEKGITVTPTELTILIESTVNEFLAHYDDAMDTVPVIVEGTPMVDVPKVEE